MPVAPSELAAAKDQLRADFEAALTQFAIGKPDDPALYLAFCMGTMMCMMTLRGFVEESDNALLPYMSSEECTAAYFEAARSALYAN
jgi:hypothetical protein